MKPALRYLTATELAYRRRLIAAVYGIAAVLITARWIAALQFGLPEDSPEQTAQQTEISLWITIAAGALVTHGLFSGMKRQRRDVMLIPLPVAPRTLVSSRLLAVLAIQVIAFVIWIGAYALSWRLVPSGHGGLLSVATIPPHVYAASPWTMLSMFAIGVYVCLVVALAHTWRKPWWGNVLFWVAAVFFTNFLVYPAGSSPDVFVPSYSVFESVWGSLYYCTIAATVAAATVFVHLRQTSGRV